jgi:uncharacterized membrane protein YgaE (UPF0421/DUF939 family)
MNTLFKNTTLTWWQLGLLKIAVLAIGIVIGSHWSDIFVGYTTVLLIVGGVSSVYLGIVWFKR